MGTMKDSYRFLSIDAHNIYKTNNRAIKDCMLLGFFVSIGTINLILSFIEIAYY